MKVKPIRTDKDHREALKEIERLWSAKEGTPEDDRLEVLLTLVDAYEEKRFPIDMPDPIDAIRFRLEQQGATTQSLIGVIGSRTRVHEVLQGRRGLSLPMIRRLHDHLHIPAEVLIQPARKRRTNRAA
jgi:HTH-type transcriptional regulator/antitoxin HigA